MIARMRTVLAPSTYLTDLFISNLPPGPAWRPVAQQASTSEPSWDGLDEPRMDKGAGCASLHSLFEIARSHRSRFLRSCSRKASSSLYASAAELLPSDSCRQIFLQHSRMPRSDPQ